jgi:hypothetical protein
MLLEMGWKQAISRPSPAQQLAPNSISLDLESNARLCLKGGLEAFVQSSTNDSSILEAILRVFQAIELLTKSVLERHDPTAMKDRPNYPTVLSRLATSGVALSATDILTIERLRLLRNSIQHGEPSLNYLEGIRAVRQAIVFLDRFILEQFDAWILDICAHPTRLRLLQITELSRTADALLERRKQGLQRPSHEFTSCPECMRLAIVRLAPGEGRRCLVCCYISVQPDADIDDLSADQ